MNKKSISIVTSLLILSLLMPIFTSATPCDDANRLIERSQQSPTQAESLLNQALKNCPNHPAALNDLANIKEKQDKLSEALGLYKRALKADRQLAYAYAGIGDVLMKQQNYRKAAKFFQKFLTLPDKEGHSKHVQHYEKRLKEAQDRIFVSADEIFQALSVKRNFFIPKIGVPIQFGTGSSQVCKDKVLKQCQAIAKAVRDFFRTDEKSRIRIEGHTDNEGKAQRNKDLSKKRAKKIKEWMVKQKDIPEDRLDVIGWGEDKPEESNETEHGRFLNRRVTLVRIE